jgi:hypothetical protein
VGAGRRPPLGARLLTLLLGAPLACSGTPRAGDEPEIANPAEADKVDAAAADPDAPLTLGPLTKNSFREHPAGHAWVFDGDAAPDGAPKKMDIGQAEARGYSIIDLSDDWVPYIFSEKTTGLEDKQANGYRERYIGLANDEVDMWGDPLEPHDHNYLELYGIPPSLSVVSAEWQALETDVIPCLAEAGFDPTVFERFRGTIAFTKTGQSKRAKSAKYFRAQVAKQMRKAKLDIDDAADRETASTHPKIKSMYARWREVQDEVDVIDHAQRRFRCERLFTSADGRGKFTRGVYDSETTHALASFERKHDVMGWGHFKRDNLDVLASTPDADAHARLLRVLSERVVTSTGIVEDGSARDWKGDKFRYKDESGKEHELRDLVTEYTDAVATALDMQTPESAKAALAKLSDLGDGDFDNLLVAVKLPAPPPYYSDNMKFSTHIDRGDVWYDFPYDEAGNKKGQPRRRFPHLTLYVTYADQKIPLVHWRTTIGSWRNETNEGELMLKYKNSDVGPRVWKDIVAAPVWIPPPSTPAAELIKGRWRKGKFTRDVNYAETGPGYRSAYGLVAAYHVKLVETASGEVKEFDNGIRTHGSVDYMSILKRFSHGCHRLYNMDAVRLFSFVLRHREFKRLGQQPVGIGRYIEYEERRYHMKLDTRGYKFELVEPIPVNVTEGRVVGRRHSPIEQYMPIPVKEEDLEDEDAEGDATAEIPIQPKLPFQ